MIDIHWIRPVSSYPRFCPGIATSLVLLKPDVWMGDDFCCLFKPEQLPTKKAPNGVFTIRGLRNGTNNLFQVR